MTYDLAGHELVLLLFLGSEISKDIGDDDDRTYEPSLKKARGNYTDYANYRYA